MRPEMVHAIRQAKKVTIVKDDYLSPQKAAAVAGVARKTVNHWLHTGQLHATRLPNRFWRIRRADLNRFIQSAYTDLLFRALVMTGDRLRRLVHRALYDLGIPVVDAYNVEDAIVKGSMVTIHIAVVDIGETSDGWRLAEEMRQTRSLRHVPLLLIVNRPLQGAAMKRTVKLRVDSVLLALPSGKIQFKRQFKRQFREVMQRALPTNVPR